MRLEELDEDGKKEQTSSCKMTKSWERPTEQRDDHSEHSHTAYLQVAKRVNPKSSRNKKKNFC